MLFNSKTPVNCIVDINWNWLMVISWIQNSTVWSLRYDTSVK